MGIAKSIQDRKIGIIGLGSIGQRHIKELIGLGIKQFFAYRTSKGAKEMDKGIAKFIMNIFDEDEFLSLDLDGYLITNPTSLHFKWIDKIKGKNKPIFVEKPITNDVQELLSIKDIQQGKIQVGYCLRYDDILIKVKELLDSDIIGKVYHSRFNSGQYLPLWHPYTDYRKEYFSLKQLGGGVTRTLSHELDIAIYLFGNPSKSQLINGQISDLDIDVDDYSLALLTFENHVSRIEIDFISRKFNREGKIFGTKGELQFNLVERSISIYDNKGELQTNTIIAQNNFYRSQMEAFLNISPKNVNNPASFNDSLILMKIITNEQTF